LFVSVDVFEKGKSKQGEIAAGVTGKQLEWFEKVLSEHGPKADHIVVMGHTPILRPVRTYSSSGMLTVKGRDSDFWKIMAKHGIDLYLCGEVYAVTCTQRDGIQQIAHGGLIGRTTKPNYLVVTVWDNKLVLDLKEVDLINGKGRLWQKKQEQGAMGHHHHHRRTQEAGLYLDRESHHKQTERRQEVRGRHRLLHREKQPQLEFSIHPEIIP
jgi:hypothetical protein